MSVPPLTAGPLGRRVRGPSALGSDTRRLWRLTWALGVTDFKLRFFGSVLGYLWQLMRPLMLFGILYVVFSTLFDFGEGVPNYPVSLLLGIVIFGYFSEATGGAVRAVVTRENLLRTIEFPLIAVPLATVLTATFNLLLNLIPVFVFFLLAGGDPRWSWLELPFVLALLVVFAAGLAMLLSALFVRYRDVEPIWDVILQALFYATPIIYTLALVEEKASEGVAQLITCNPLAAVIIQLRSALIGPGHPSVPEVLDGPLALIPLAIVVAIVALGLRVFSREAPRFAEDL